MSNRSKTPKTIFTFEQYQEKGLQRLITHIKKTVEDQDSNNDPVNYHILPYYQHVLNLDAYVQELRIYLRILKSAKFSGSEVYAQRPVCPASVNGEMEKEEEAMPMFSTIQNFSRSLNINQEAETYARWWSIAQILRVYIHHHEDCCSEIEEEMEGGEGGGQNGCEST